MIEQALEKRAARDEFQFRWVAAEGDTTSPTDELPTANKVSALASLRVLREVILSSMDVESAGFSKYQSEQKTLELILSPRGREKFAQATANNVGRQLAVIWRGKVIVAPMIQSQIASGHGSFDCKFGDVEAQEFLDYLNHRPAPHVVGSEVLK